MTHLKLQKLCYYAQGYALAILGRPLFKDSIEAWEHGPVVRAVYERFRGSGRNPITPSLGFNEHIFSPEERELLKRVEDDKGHYDGWHLRETTHNELPWRSVYGRRNAEIPLSTMRAWFRANLV